MKNMKKLIAIITVIVIIGAAGIVYAAEVKTPSQIVSDLTGKSESELYEQRANGETYGAIADESGKLEEFKAQMLEQKKAVLDQRVKDGKLTQEQADEIYKAIKDNQSTCDGTGKAQIGKKYGVGFGMGSGLGNGGKGNGSGCGNGQGQGSGQGCGACLAE